MNKEIINRVNKIADYVILSKNTIRKTANIFKVSKSTVHKDLQERLKNININKYYKVKVIMNEHTKTRHLKGGEATKQLFLKKRKLTL